MSDTMPSSSVDQALQYFVVWIGLALCSLSVDQILQCGVNRSGTVHTLLCGVDRSGTVHSSHFTVWCE